MVFTAILGVVQAGKFISAKTAIEAVAARQNYLRVDQEGTRLFDFVGIVEKTNSGSEN